MKRVSSFACVYLFMTCLALPFASLADGLVLTWNGARGAAWDDSSTANWLDNGNNAVAWTDGATAVFPAGAFVEIKGTVKPTSIMFSGDGATLAGSGRILLSNSVSGNVGTTNSITALVVGDASFEKLGAGTLAVSFAKGAVEVKEGALLLAGSRCANLRVSAASGRVAGRGGKYRQSVGQRLLRGYDH